MANFKLNGVLVATESGGTVVLDSAVTGIPAAGVTGVLPSTVTGTGGLRSMQVFNSTGTSTWTKPPGITTIRVFLTGAGGGGGHGSSGAMAGGGGAGGGTAVRIYDVSSTTTVAVTIGAGGTGAPNNSTNPADSGDTSSFPGPSQTITATGGVGGNKGGGISGHAQGGIGTGGHLNLRGDAGACGVDSNFAIGGSIGGGSYWAGAGYGMYNGVGEDGSHGGGGGGGQGANGGGDGGNGICVIEEYS